MFLLVLTRVVDFFLYIDSFRIKTNLNMLENVLKTLIECVLYNSYAVYKTGF